MPELNTIESPKTAGFVDRGYNQTKKRAAMEAEEKEIARLEAEARGEEYKEEPMAKDLRQPKYRMQVIPNKKKPQRKLKHRKMTQT